MEGFVGSIFVLLGGLLFVLAKMATRGSWANGRAWIRREWYSISLSICFVVIAYIVTVASGMNPSKLIEKIGYDYELPLNFALGVMGYGSVSFVRKVAQFAGQIGKKKQ